MKIDAKHRRLVYEEGEQVNRATDVEVSATVENANEVYPGQVRLWIKGEGHDGGELFVNEHEWAALVAYVGAKLK